MTAIERVLMQGEYSRFQELLSGIRPGSFDPMGGFESCKRFLVRILSRAVLDVCMYPEDNPHHASAKQWFFGSDDADDSLFPIRYGELVDLVGLDWMAEQVMEMAEEDNVHRDRVRDMKKLLYNLSDNGSAG